MRRGKHCRVSLLGLTFCLLTSGWAAQVALADEEDFFPLTLWATWGAGQYPQNQEQWDQERVNLDNILANHLEAMLWAHEEEIMDSLCDNRGYWLTAEVSEINDSLVSFWKYWPKVWAGSLHVWPDSVDSCIVRMYERYGSHPGLYGYLVAHEQQALRDPFYYPGFEYVCHAIGLIDPNPHHKSIAIDNIQNVDSTFFDAVPSLDVFRSGGFPFTAGLPHSGQAFQDRLDLILARHQMCLERFKDRHTKWHGHIQAGRWGEPDTATRRPTGQEIRVQAFLALSRGAKGISYFPYFSKSPPGNWYDGLVTEERPRQPWSPYFDSVAVLNQDLRVIAPILRRLECTDAFDTSSIPPESYIKGVTGSDYVEIGTFLGCQGAESAYPPTDYFMLVNRHCLPQDTVTLTVEIEKEGTWFCRDMLTGEDTVLVSNPSGRFYYTKVVSPGDGCLVLLKKAKYGVIPGNEIWYEYEYIAGDVTVPDTVTIGIEPGTLIKAVAGYDNQHGPVDSTLCELIVEGALTADAGWVVGADTIVFTSSADTPQPGDWYGIRFRPNSSGRVRRCLIEYGYCGVGADSSNLLYIMGSKISRNQFAGIVVESCSPSIAGNEISFNKIYGIYTNLSNSRIESNTLNCNWTYGVVSKSSSGWISQNRIAISQFTPATAEYGIVLKYLGAATYLIGNYISGYAQGGIGCSRVWAIEIAQDTVASNGYYGLHCLNSSPVVSQTRIIGHDTGVLCVENSYPILGWITGSDTIGGKNSIYDNAQFHVANYNEFPDSIRAELNWWGASPPNPMKFFGPVDYMPWLGGPPEGGGGAQSAGDGLAIPRAYGLSLAYPNPFGATTIIRYQLPEPSHTTLKVYNVAGRLVQTLVDERTEAGYYQIVWKGEDDSGRRVASGIYFCRMSAKKLGGSPPEAQAPLEHASDGEASDYKSCNKLVFVR